MIVESGLGERREGGWEGKRQNKGSAILSESRWRAAISCSPQKTITRIQRNGFTNDEIDRHDFFGVPAAVSGQGSQGREILASRL